MIHICNTNPFAHIHFSRKVKLLYSRFRLIGTSVNRDSRLLEQNELSPMCPDQANLLYFKTKYE